jgi:quinoprotein glucose dehydrogenase
MTSPPIVYGNLIITGSAVQEFPAKGAAGDVRAWDARDGHLVWTFHSVPRKGEKGYDTWAPGSAEGRSGVNAWGFLSVDEKRGIVSCPLAPPPLTAMVGIGRATICSARHWSRRMPGRANIYGIFRWFITTSGMVT